MHRFFNDKILWWSYSIIVVIAIFSFSMYFIGNDSSFMKEFSLNIAAESVGILLTVFLIDAVIKKKDLQEYTKREAIAFQQLHYPIQNHLKLLFNIFKASVLEKPNKYYDEVADLFDEAYFSEINYFDFSKRAPIAFETTWFIHISIETEKFVKSIEKTLDKYSFYIESDSIEVMEKILDSNFLRVLSIAPAIHELDIIDGDKNDYNLFAWKTLNMIVEFKVYTRLLVELVEIYNSKVENDKKLNKIINDFWEESVAPYLGDARININ